MAYMHNPPPQQIPDNPVGTIVFFPGCSRASRTFWPYQAGGCEECQGGPGGARSSVMLLHGRGPAGPAKDLANLAAQPTLAALATPTPGPHASQVLNRTCLLCDFSTCGPAGLARPPCAGFPEEVAMTKMALARGYAVLTPTAKSRTACWSSGGSPGRPAVPGMTAICEVHEK